jgi:hypothetical protein
MEKAKEFISSKENGIGVKKEFVGSKENGRGVQSLV